MFFVAPHSTNNSNSHFPTQLRKLQDVLKLQVSRDKLYDRNEDLLHITLVPKKSSQEPLARGRSSTTRSTSFFLAQASVRVTSSGCSLGITQKSRGGQPDHHEEKYWYRRVMSKGRKQLAKAQAFPQQVTWMEIRSKTLVTLLLICTQFLL